LLKAHQDLEVQFGDLWSIISKNSTNNKASTSQVSVKTCDNQIAQENDHLKREVKNLELEVNKLKKQAKVQPAQDKHSNVVKKLEKGKPAPKIASQPPKKHVQNEKDEKVEHVRSVFLNARRSHIKSGIGYKNSDKHNSRVNTKDQEFIKFTKANVQQEKKQSIKTTNNASYSYTNAYVYHMSYHDFDASYGLMRNKLSKIIALHVGHITRGLCMGAQVSFTNLR
jgi:hypothetical protein